LQIVKVVILKKVNHTFRNGLEIETIRLEISGTAPYVESLTEIKEKKN